MRTAVVVVSDLHVGSIHALCPPGPLDLKHGGKYHPTATQEQLWEWWLDFARNIPKADRWILVLNGDIVEGVSRHSHLIIRDSVSFQTDLAIQTISEFLTAAPGEPEVIYATRGTPWHTSNESDQEILVTDALRCEDDPETGASTWWQLDLDVDGTLFDFKHHPNGWSMTPGFGSVAASHLARKIKVGREDDKEEIPDISIRSHVHQAWDGGYNPPYPRVHTTPCWKIGFDDYVSKRGFEVKPHLGGLYILVDSKEKPERQDGPRLWLDGAGDATILRRQYRFQRSKACRI